MERNDGLRFPVFKNSTCAALEIPITGGNVSFYNETLGRSIDPTPILGVLGMIEDASHALGMGFRNEGDAILLLDGGRSGKEGPHSPQRTQSATEESEFSSSEYARTIHGIEAGTPPASNVTAEKQLIGALVALAAEGKLQSAHELSDGGVAVTIAESCFAGDGLSANVSLMSEEPDEVALFGERGARAIVSVRPENVGTVRQIAAQYEVATVDVGRVTRGEFRIELNGRTVISAAAPLLADDWNGAFGRLLDASDLRKVQ